MVAFETSFAKKGQDFRYDVELPGFIYCRPMSSVADFFHLSRHKFCRFLKTRDHVTHRQRKFFKTYLFGENLHANE